MKYLLAKTAACISAALLLASCAQNHNEADIKDADPAVSLAETSSASAVASPIVSAMPETSSSYVTTSVTTVSTVPETTLPPIVYSNVTEPRKYYSDSYISVLDTETGKYSEIKLNGESLTGQSNFSIDDVKKYGDKLYFCGESRNSTGEYNAFAGYADLFSGTSEIKMIPDTSVTYVFYNSTDNTIICTRGSYSNFMTLNEDLEVISTDKFLGDYVSHELHPPKIQIYHAYDNEGNIYLTLIGSPDDSPHGWYLLKANINHDISLLTEIGHLFTERIKYDENIFELYSDTYNYPRPALTSDGNLYLWSAYPDHYIIYPADKDTGEVQDPITIPRYNGSLFLTNFSDDTDYILSYPDHFEAYRFGSEKAVFSVQCDIGDYWWPSRYFSDGKLYSVVIEEK